MARKLPDRYMKCLEAAAGLGPNGWEAGSVRSVVIVADLDGTLVKTDVLVESFLVLLKRVPYYVLCLPFWLGRGKAYFKDQIARRGSLDVSVLPYRDDVLDYLKAQRAEGRFIALATAADMHSARQIADHLNLFNVVLASDGITNLAGEAKRKSIVNEFGEKGFDYIGDDRDNVVVWASARKAIMVNPSPPVVLRVSRVAQVDQIFQDRKRDFGDHVNALRPHHWLKNLLVFVPLLGAHRFDEIDLLEKALLGFLALGCFASSGYLLNDLLDLPSDRRHPLKRYRPFAAGDLSLTYALFMIPALVILACLISALVSPLFLGVGLIYFGLSVTYSLYIKPVALWDVIVLAALYALRIIGGSAAVAIWPSPWLLAFSAFLFFSLALVKRYSELALNPVKARGYELSDKEMLASMGIASGYVAILVLALYINSSAAHILYRRYEALWLLCPLLLYWISHLWLSAHRGRIPDDPVVFVTSDWTSRILLLLMLAVGIVAL